MHLPSLAILALTLFPVVLADCSTHALVQSDLKTCESLVDGTQNCNIYTTAEITLPTLHSESCIWFMDKMNRHLFSIKLRLDEVSCSFHTKREYFTFPVTPKHISQISCIYNKYCGQGVHCVQGTTSSQGLRFEAETPESRDFPGISACTAGGLGVGCTILTRAACNFHRTWYEPDLLHSYEVSSITGHQCHYHLSITHLENNTVSRVSLSDTAYTPTGVKITLLGAFDQPQLHLSESFIQRVGRPTEAYLAPTCPRNNPRAGQIGAIQANSSYTKSFVFDPTLTTCDFFEDTLRCQTATDPLVTLRTTQEHLLPLQRDLHLFKIKDEQLFSSLLVTSAVRIQLLFSNYKIAVQQITVCPTFDDTTFETSGCYKCPILARMSVKIHSTCQPGVVYVEFQDINTHTKALHLTTEPSTYVIKFLAERKCYAEKLCLRAQMLIQCQTVSFCLDEPSVDLLNLDTNYTLTASANTPTLWSDWLRLPSLDTSYILLKLLGSSLFIICVSITIFSTLITCCCKAR